MRLQRPWRRSGAFFCVAAAWGNDWWRRNGLERECYLSGNGLGSFEGLPSEALILSACVLYRQLPEMARRLAFRQIAAALPPYLGPFGGDAAGQLRKKPRFASEVEYLLAVEEVAASPSLGSSAVPIRVLARDLRCLDATASLSPSFVTFTTGAAEAWLCALAVFELAVT